MRRCARNLIGVWLGGVACVLLAGCGGAPKRNDAAIHAYYGYDFATAREQLRGETYQSNDEQTILNHLRLGMAALADGDAPEAERALGRVFDMLSTAGLNKDRTTAAVLFDESVRIWKGEPFEQALAYHYVATLYAVLGDWENARAASSNALFRLTDFGANQSAEDLIRESGNDEDYLNSGYTAVDTDFALGFLMSALAADLSGGAGADEQYDAALEINPGLADLVGVLRGRDFDTLLIVDFGKGPTKIAYGQDDALVRFVEQDGSMGLVDVSVNGVDVWSSPAVCDVNAMARHHKWNNLEDVRRAKSFIGDALMLSGAYVAASSEKGEHQLVGVGMMLAGLINKSNARADTRYIETMPAAVHLIPLTLGGRSEVVVTPQLAPGARYVMADCEPGTVDKPRAVYVRLHGPDSPQPAWLSERTLWYGNDHAAIEGEQAYPWILGGRDVSTPSRAVWEHYRDQGWFAEGTYADLLDLYESEGILIGSGMESRPGEARNPSFRHVLEGGTGLFTPLPDSMGYKRLMFTDWRAYEPKSERVRNAARRSGVTSKRKTVEEIYR
jgi:tetratricopeptide (TPR) repeat protein